MSHVQSVNVSQKNEKFFFNAKSFSPDERRELALKAISDNESIIDLAKKFGVSRKFIYAQKDKAVKALENAFIQQNKDDEVLFTIPVTRNFIQASMLSLSLNCHASERGIVQHFRDIYDYETSETTVHNVLYFAAKKAFVENKKINLDNVEIAAHDEIFQGAAPILVGCDAQSTFTYLLAKEKKRDMFTWGMALLECQERGLDPAQIIADSGTGLRAGQASVWPNLPCDGDVFHILMDIGKAKSYLENRAIGTIARVYELEKNVLQLQKQKQGLSTKLEKICEKSKTPAPTTLVQLNIFTEYVTDVYDVEKSSTELSSKILELEKAIMNIKIQQNELSKTLSITRVAEKSIIKLVDTIETVKDWLQHDILSVAGSDYSKRCEIFDFIVQALVNAEKEYPSKHVRKMICRLKKQRDDLLRFVLRNDVKLATVAKNLKLEPSVLRELFEVYGIPYENKHRWAQEQKLREKIGAQFHLAIARLNEIIDDTVRASSVVENLNSRLRTYFFLRKAFDQESLNLLQFYLNHKTFLRSEHPDRVAKSPAELLSGQPHLHWLEMLGFKRFSQTVAQA